MRGLWVDISFLGHSCFRLRGKDVTLITDPYQFALGRPPLRLQAEIVTISHDHPGHNNAAVVSGNPKVIQGPGEYEIRSVLITGVATFHDGVSGRERGRNTIYVIQMEDVRLCHLGDLGHVLNAEQIDEIGSVDVLFVPARGAVLDMSRASEVISQIEPSIIVPMHFQAADEEGLASIEKFCHEMGLRQIVPQPKLAVTKTSIPQETQVIVMDVRQ
ncbi:MAG TPA: MBL fold metallo-hydrolase [Chloroflexota bacterium]|nr:MBL fold metallo-hydrolase [Chloroflexota bacterium]